MQKINVRNALLDFKKALGINNFSNELSETEFKLISLVSDAQSVDENINLTKISEELNITRSAVTQIATKLEKKKYIEKYTLSSNKKEIYLKIGEKAIEQYNMIMEKISLFCEKLFNEIGQEGVDNIDRYINICKRIGLEMKEEVKLHA